MPVLLDADRSAKFSGAISFTVYENAIKLLELSKVPQGVNAAAIVA
jgi:hypothetical protein